MKFLTVLALAAGLTACELDTSVPAEDLPVAGAPAQEAISQIFLSQVLQQLGTTWNYARCGNNVYSIITSRGVYTRSVPGGTLQPLSWPCASDPGIAWQSLASQLSYHYVTSTGFNPYQINRDYRNYVVVP